jgi:hypothetical protein
VLFRSICHNQLLILPDLLVGFPCSITSPRFLFLSIKNSIFAGCAILSPGSIL